MTQMTNSVFPGKDEIPPVFRINKFKNGLDYLINGKIITAVRGTEVVSPIKLRTEAGLVSHCLGQTPLLSSRESDQALFAALKAFGQGSGEWPCLPVKERIEHMEIFIQKMQGMEEVFCLLEMWEIAKPLDLCRDEFKRTIQYIRDTIEALKKLDKSSSNITQAGEFTAQIKRCPLGVTLCMGPFNYPLNETFAMMIPALIMGNTIIMKPPRYGALCTTPLLPLFAEAFPPGVINVINGNGEEIIPPLITGGDISVLGFIGSARVANHIINQHPANNRLRTILGLEAKNPAFIFPDADLKLAVRECLQGALEFNGQRCTAIKHIWVHDEVCQEFTEMFAEALDQVKCGMPWEEEVVVTPLPEEGKSKWLSELVEDACSKGARIVNRRGGNYEDSLYYPTALFPVDASMQIFQVEQFGPVVPITSFKELSELESYMQASGYGQQASIFSRSPDIAAPLIDMLVNQVSRVNLNSRCRRGPDDLPFTGRKDSAEGTLSVADALRAFSIRSLVVANQEGRELFFSVLSSNKSSFLRI